MPVAQFFLHILLTYANNFPTFQLPLYNCHPHNSLNNLIKSKPDDPFSLLKSPMVSFYTENKTHVPYYGSQYLYHLSFSGLLLATLTLTLTMVQWSWHLTDTLSSHSSHGAVIPIIFIFLDIVNLFSDFDSLFFLPPRMFWTRFSHNCFLIIKLLIQMWPQRGLFLITQPILITIISFCIICFTSIK